MAWSANAVEPIIKKLNSYDPVFYQFEKDVEQARMLLAKNGKNEDILDFLVFYQWEGDGTMDLLSLAARCTLPYDALASLNRIPHNRVLEIGEKLLLPSVPGLWIYQRPWGDLGYLLLSRAKEKKGIPLSLGKEKLLFFPNTDFNPTERAFFLNTAFRLPLPVARLTSSWGYRSDPFTGERSFHGGVDLAAPVGTEVYAAREGEVVDIGQNSVYGNYIVMRHGEGWTSLYGHLSKIETSLHKWHSSGSIIGRVGSTGMSTGPHLHFELSRNGDSVNPGSLLPKGF